MTRYYVKTVNTGRYLVAAGYGSAKWTGECDEAAEFHTFEEARRASSIAGPLEEEGLQIVMLAEVIVEFEG